MRLVVTLTDEFISFIIIIRYKEMCQYLEYLHNSVNENFSKLPIMFQNDARIKELFRGKDRAVDFKVKEYKCSFINVVSDSTLKLSIWKLPFVKF